MTLMMLMGGWDTGLGHMCPTAVQCSEVQCTVPTPKKDQLSIWKRLTLINNENIVCVLNSTSKGTCKVKHQHCWLSTIWLSSACQWHTGPRENTCFGFETQKRHVGWQTILNNFCSGAAILIFVRLAANHDFVRKYPGAKSWFAGKRTKITIAAHEQKLFRIVFPTYMSLFGSQIQKK